MTTIAIAEDHQALIDGIELLYRYEENISIVGMANDGKELLEIVRKKQPKVIIMDIRMPKMDGIEATKVITQEFPKTKVIAFSMFDQEQAVYQMREAGAIGYVLKNSPLRILDTAVQTVIKGEEYFDPNLDIDGEFAFAKAQKNTSPLSKSERAILKLIAQNKTSSEIAAERFTAVSTVEKHRKNMMRKLGLKGKGELLKYAIERKYDF
jgi:two-component system nitrate/nitrite response regulator NarL